MNAQDLDAFYHANLYINIGTLNNDRQLRGRIVQNLIGPAQELSKSPILLESSPPNRTMVNNVHADTCYPIFPRRYTDFT